MTFFSVHLYFLDAPKDVSVTSAVNISNLKEGDELKLKCSVGDSNPPVNQFYWYFNNSQLQQQHSQIFTISIVKPENSGFYNCSANYQSKAIPSKNNVHVSVKCKYFFKFIYFSEKSNKQILCCCYY